MKGSLEAIRFLTILPVGRGVGQPDATMLPWFPAVGLLIGGLWMGFDHVISRDLPLTLRAALDVMFLVVITGGLHLDGLADTADGLFSHRGRDETMRIMQDSRTGTWGVLALLAVLGLKVVALYEILFKGDAQLLILIPIYGRMAMLMGIVVLPYGRGEEGIGHLLFQSGRKAGVLAPGVLLLGLGTIILLDGAGSWTANGVFVGTVALILLRYRSLLGCVTGDMLGALGETVETVILIVLAGC